MPDEVVHVRLIVDYHVEVRDEAELVRAALADHETYARDNTRPGGDPDWPEENARQRRKLADPDLGVVSSVEWLLGWGSPWPSVPGAEIVSMSARAEEYEPDYGVFPRNFGDQR